MRLWLQCCASLATVLIPVATCAGLLIWFKFKTLHFMLYKIMKLLHKAFSILILP